MPFQLNDSTAGVQRMQFDNSGNTEFGPATPNSPLSFQGRPLLDGSYLAQSVARPDGMPRVTGAVALSGGSTVTVGCPASAGFGSIDGEADIVSFSSDKTSFVVGARWDSGSRTVNYSVF